MSITYLKKISAS